MSKVEVKGLRNKRLIVHAGTEVEFSEILPGERLAEIHSQLDAAR